MPMLRTDRSIRVGGLLGVVWMLASAGLLFGQTAAPATPDRLAAERLFAPRNLVAWCIVPFDAAHRGPRERAEMLVRLGFTKVAYDWRDEHVPTFESEILEYGKHGLEYFAFWGEHDRAFELFAKYGLHPQIWITSPSPDVDQAARVKVAADELLSLAQRTRTMGCPLGLYNHGGWGGEPENLVAVCRQLRERTGSDHIGIVYNFHHAHDRIASFQRDLEQMLPYLLCVNINGMNERAEPKILPVGQGQHERAMLWMLVASGYKGPIGIINHREELDAELGLRENLAGLQKIEATFTDGN